MEVAATPGKESPSNTQRGCAQWRDQAMSSCKLLGLWRHHSVSMGQRLLLERFVAHRLYRRGSRSRWAVQQEQRLIKWSSRHSVPRPEIASMAMSRASVMTLIRRQSSLRCVLASRIVLCLQKQRLLAVVIRAVALERLLPREFIAQATHRPHHRAQPTPLEQTAPHHGVDGTPLLAAVPSHHFEKCTFKTSTLLLHLAMLR